MGVVKKATSKYNLTETDVIQAHKVAMRGKSKTRSTGSRMLTYRGGLEAAVCQGPGIYYVGIIDMLQERNWTKKFERFFKSIVLQKSSGGISCAPPSMYQERFMKRMHDITISDFDYFQEQKINMKDMLSNTHAVHIFPPPEAVQENIEMARKMSKSKTYTQTY